MKGAKFVGFSADAIPFLRELEEHNERDWFMANKARYDDGILAHASVFVEALGLRLQEGISPGIQYDTRVNGAGSMMRIYRDVRFSQDKSPYKTNAAFIFWEGSAKKMENPSFGFQFGTAGAGIYGGMMQFSKEALGAYRSAVVNDELGESLETLLREAGRQSGIFIHGERYARVPAGFDAQHPRASLLQQKGLYLSVAEIDTDLVSKPALVDELYGYFEKMAPLHRWLVEVMAGR